MTILLASLMALAFQTPDWTWTLYEGEGPIVLANEVPDTLQLRATLECEPGSGLTRLSLYDPPMGAGFATLSSGDASATTEARAQPDHTRLVLRADHPVFSAFLNTGELTVSIEDIRRPVQVERQYLPTLRRFAEQCGG